MIEDGEQLSAGEGSFVALYRESLVPTITLDLHEREIIDLNLATERLLGLPRDRILGRPGSDFLGGDVDDGVLRRIGLAGGSLRTFRNVNTTDGERPVELYMVPTDTEGVIFVQALALPESTLGGGGLPNSLGEDDVARELGADVVLPAGSYRNLEAVLDRAPVATIVVDFAQRGITRVNAAAAELLGAPPATIVGRPIVDFLGEPGSGAELRQRLLDAGLADGELTTTAITASGLVAVDVNYSIVTGTTLAVFQILPTRRAGGRARGRAFAASAGRRRPSTTLRAARSINGPAAAGPERGSWIAAVAGGSMVALGLVVLVVGWWLGIDAVTRIAPSLVSMKANTAVGLALFGIALVLAGPGNASPVRRLSLALVTLIGVLTITEYGFDLDLGIDELLAAETSSVGTQSPGRMGLNTAIGFALLGVGMLAVDLGRSKRWLVAGQICVLGGFALAYLALLAHLSGASGGRSLGSATQMAVHTSFGIIVISFGALSGMTHDGLLRPLSEPLTGGRFARVLIPVGFGIVVAAVALVSLLGDLDLIDDADLRLAFLGVVISIVMFVAVLRGADSSNRIASESERTRLDLAAVLAAFSDDHYRVDEQGTATPVSGAGVAASTTLDTLVPTSEVERLDRLVRSTRDIGVASQLTFDVAGAESRELRVAPLPGGEIAISIRDVSELAAARDELQALTESLEQQVHDRTAELERINRALGRSNADLQQFAYLASHDLQEPLRMVSTFVEKLANRLGDDLDERSSQYIHFAVDGAERMAALIDGLLQFSRAGRSDLELRRVELSDVLDDLIATLAQGIADRGAKVDVAPGLPAVHADEVLLRQVVQNLLTNALKFTDAERVAEIEVGATDRGDGMVEVWVSDNGIGIDREFEEKVFQMFQRLHARTDYEGTGIGLALVARIVESHGGSVWIDHGHAPPGTKFVFTLPSCP